MADILNKSVAYCLNIHRMGTQRKVDNKKIDLRDKVNGTRADEDSVSVEMQILRCKEYDRIKSLDRAAKADLETLALPSPIRRGIYLIPLKCIERVNGLVQDYAARREGMVDDFILAYRNAIEDARRRLNGFFNEANYPSEADVRSRFGVDWSFLDLGVPTGLADISPELFVQEQKAQRKRLEEAAEEIKLALRSTMRQLVDNLVAAVTPGPDGKYKKFYESNFENLKKFLTDFSDRNIVDDDELEDLVVKAREVIDGTNVEEIRDDATYKQKLIEAMAPVKETVAAMVTTRGRRFDFDED